MSDRPDCLLLLPHLSDALMRFAGFPHSLALLPHTMTLGNLTTSPHVIGTFLIEPDSIGEVLNGAALPAYLAQRAPVLIHARRTRDLRPILRRSVSFAARGYRIELLTREERR